MRQLTDVDGDWPQQVPQPMNAHCPVCDKLMDADDRQRWPEFPFCSSKCRMADLGRWLDQRYVMPVEPTDDLDGEELES